MSHSKLPWTYEPQPYKQDAIWAGTRLVANVIGDDAQTEANAAHIVKCVNEQPAKDALIAELVEALHNLREWPENTDNYVAADKALTKARGGDNA